MRSFILVVLTCILVAAGLVALDRVQRGERLDLPWPYPADQEASEGRAPPASQPASPPESGPGDADRSAGSAENGSAENGSAEHGSVEKKRAAPPPPPAQMPEPGPQPESSDGAKQDAPSPGAPAPEAPGGAGLPAPAADEPPAPPKAEEAENAEWDIVPVYYGTDRAVDANDKRLLYGSGRGRRLELGRALVTVPKAHVVPSIERPWAIRVPYLNVTLYEQAEDPKTHFTLKELRALKEDEFLEFVRIRLQKSARFKDHALIFIHGYNTSFDFAIYRTAQIAYDLKFDGAAFAYSWPSGGGLSSYTYDRESSGQAEPFLKDFITLVAAKTGAKSVSIIAHSMGNGPTLEVLRDLKLQKPAGVEISQIILAAPDVDRDNFENIAAEIKGLAKGVTLYAAANDRALRVSRNFYGGVPRAGDVPQTGPLVIPGVDTIDVTAASTDAFSLNHSGYAENNVLLKDIGILIEAGTRPPKARTPILDVVTTPAGEYWRYPKAP